MKELLFYMFVLLAGVAMGGMGLLFLCELRREGDLLVRGVFTLVALAMMVGGLLLLLLVWGLE